VLAPRISHRSDVFRDDPPDPIQFVRAEAIVRRKRERIKPELALVSISLDMNMHRFAAIETVEEEPVRSGDVWNGRHQAFRGQVFIVGVMLV
jgi:hypothetical protein